MRRVLIVAGVSVLALTPLLAAPVGASRPAASANPASDICEPMVANAIVASLGTPLPAPQTGAWSGHTFVCTYPLNGGQLTLSVDDLRTKAKARAAYQRLSRAAGKQTRLNGIGNRAFQSADGTMAVVKDQFVLHVDPSAVPAPTKKSDLAFAAAVGTISCWTGGS